MMTYRTIKKVLGETSLERKCRFLFGGGLMLLITGSFYFYAQRNAQLVYEQRDTTGRVLVAPALMSKHSRYLSAEEKRQMGLEDQPEPSVTLEDMKDALQQKAGIPRYSWWVGPAGVNDAEARPFNEASYQALEKIQAGKEEWIEPDAESDTYNYYSAVYAQQSCLRCHNDAKWFPGRRRDIREGELMGMVEIRFPQDNTRQTLAWNKAILWATAIITAFLAMLAAYAIVRYVIVKPVLYLKDVSEQIAHGNLDLRADIQTGDEFEELSHAFNRMLRHLVTVQDELRGVNKDLDNKVDELAQVNLRLYEMNHLKDEFLATMSHELRTPLNSILGFSDVLSTSDNLTERQQRYARNIQKSGNDLKALIDDLLDLAKIESGKMELQLAPVAGEDLVERQVASLALMAEKKNIQLSWEVDPELPVLTQDAGKLQQILNNLLSNAIKFTPEGGRVQVRLSRAGRTHFELAVEDTGIGIPLEDQANIFEKFRQGKAVPGQKDALTREYGGTGLGLSIVKELSKLLGGEVNLESEFGKGSLFSVRLPIELQEPAEPRARKLLPSDYDLTIFDPERRTEHKKTDDDVA